LHRINEIDAIRIIDHTQLAGFGGEKRKIDNRAVARLSFRKIDMPMNNTAVERIFVARILFDPLRRRDCREREKEKRPAKSWHCTYRATPGSADRLVAGPTPD